MAGGPVTAQDSRELVELINAYRSSPHSCEGKRATPAGALTVNSVLGGAQIAATGRLIEALKARGYPAASAYAIQISGPPTASGVLRYAAERYCRALLGAQYAEIGVRREGNEWMIVLARRLLSPDLGDWRNAGSKILRLTNEARATPRTCGNRRFAAAPRIAWNDRLAAAALAHSHDMAGRNYLEHQDPGGAQASDRVTRQGYAWQEVAENIAGGQGSPEQVMAGWLASPVHCANIMNNRLTEMGAAYVVNPNSDATIYWTQVFGRRDSLPETVASPP